MHQKGQSDYRLHTGVRLRIGGACSRSVGSTCTSTARERWVHRTSRRLPQTKQIVQRGNLCYLWTSRYQDKRKCVRGRFSSGVLISTSRTKLPNSLGVNVQGLKLLLGEA
jgi:hypothetical protein